MHFERRERQAQAIPLTPLIDVVFLLIVFFMLTTSFRVSESLEISLPNVSDAPAPASDTNDEILFITLPKPGFILYGQELVDEIELEARLFDVVGSNPNQKIIVQSGEEVSVQELVKVMDLAYLTGARQLSIQEWDEQSMPTLLPLESFTIPIVDTPSDREIGVRRYNQMPKSATKSGSLGTVRKKR